MFLLGTYVDAGRRPKNAISDARLCLGGGVAQLAYRPRAGDTARLGLWGRCCEGAPALRVVEVAGALEGQTEAVEGLPGAAGIATLDDPSDGPRDDDACGRAPG